MQRKIVKKMYSHVESGVSTFVWRMEFRGQVDCRTDDFSEEFETGVAD